MTQLLQATRVLAFRSCSIQIKLQVPLNTGGLCTGLETRSYTHSAGRQGRVLYLWKMATRKADACAVLPCSTLGRCR